MSLLLGLNALFYIARLTDDPALKDQAERAVATLTASRGVPAGTDSRWPALALPIERSVIVVACATDVYSTATHPIWHESFDAF
jgi:hypothetical protein